MTEKQFIQRVVHRAIGRHSEEMPLDTLREIAATSLLHYRKRNRIYVGAGEIRDQTPYDDTLPDDRRDHPDRVIENLQNNARRITYSKECPPAILYKDGSIRLFEDDILVYSQSDWAAITGLKYLMNKAVSPLATVSDECRRKLNNAVMPLVARPVTTTTQRAVEAKRAMVEVVKDGVDYVQEGARETRDKTLAALEKTSENVQQTSVTVADTTIKVVEKVVKGAVTVGAIYAGFRILSLALDPDE